MAAGVRVGNALGAGNAHAAKKTIKVSLALVGNLKKLLLYIPNVYLFNS